LKVLIVYNIDHNWDAAELSDVRNSNRILCEALKEEGIETHAEELCDPHLEKILDGHSPEDTLVFNLCDALPGIPYSERKVTEILKGRGFTYTGNVPEVIELSYDKQKTKELLSSIGVRVPYGEVLAPAEAAGWSLFPAIVKPSREHCSLTITENSVVYDTTALKEQIMLVNNELNQPALVEDFIDGREFHVSVWNNGAPEILPLAEMDFSAFSEARERLCTYESKFLPGSGHYEKIETLIPAPLEERLYKRLAQKVLATWHGFGCVDYARFDFRLRDDKFYLLDINPNNDISFDTSFALAAEAVNYSYGQMVKRIVMMAAERHPLYGSGEWPDFA
jgi:D-alanine-D-alanine ligase